LRNALQSQQENTPAPIIDPALDLTPSEQRELGESERATQARIRRMLATGRRDGSLPTMDIGSACDLIINSLRTPIVAAARRNRQSNEQSTRELVEKVLAALTPPGERAAAA
jgi:hypothetical protein